MKILSKLLFAGTFCASSFINAQTQPVGNNLLVTPRSIEVKSPTKDGPIYRLGFNIACDFNKAFYRHYSISSNGQKLLYFGAFGNGGSNGLRYGYIGDDPYNPWMSFLNNRRIGIGTTQPDYTLDIVGDSKISDKLIIGNVTKTPEGYGLYVRGGILAEKVKVAIHDENNWADYVFDNDYHLKSLTEVESFINTNHHLPDVPSAKEVVESGVNMAEMDAILLQKIEELTLYLIKVNKENQTLKNEIRLLKQNK